MSISNSLLRAAKIQEKIDLLREQLVDLLERTRVEIATDFEKDQTLSPLGGSSKKQKLARGSRSRSATAPGRVDRGSEQGRGRTQRRGRSPLAGRKRAASPTGPLAPAVVKVLRANRRRPMRVHDILAGLLADGYQFNTSEPKKNLAARIYRLKGVKQVEAGLFGLV